MSLHREEQVACPNCQLRQTVTIWESLNAQIDPEAKEDLLEGKIHLFSCRACGHRALIAAPLLYHDMQRHFVVQYVALEATEDREFLDRFDTDGRYTAFRGAVEEMGFTGDRQAFSYMIDPHIVFDMGEMVRYISFRERLFDHQAFDFKDS